MHPTIHEYAEKLVSKMPGDLKVPKYIIVGIYSAVSAINIGAFNM